MVKSILSADVMKIQQAKEEKDRLEAENRTLRENVHRIESERKNLQKQVQS